MSKIYVSSTFIDLQDYRAQVERVIRRMGHEDVAMEYYVAEDQRPVDRCLSDVAACDLYIGIFAWRYGWIPKKNNRKKLSITEMEYRQAQKTGKPCLIFLLDGKAPWPPDFIDDDKTQIKRLRNELSEKHGTGPGFKSADELGRLVAEAIHKWEKEHGYIPIASSIPEYNLDAYYQALRKRYQTLALEGLTPPQKEEYLQIQLRSVFVEQNVRESPPPVELPKEVWEKLQRDKDVHAEDLPSGITFDDVRRARDVYFEKPSRPVLDVLTDARYQQTIILGDPGSGKSTLARYIMLSLIDPTTATLTPALSRLGEGVLPLLIELRTYTGACIEGNCGTFLEFLEYLGKTEGWHLTQAALHNHLKNDGRAVVIFDGLDEIFDPEKREQITRQIVGFTNDYPKTRIIVTSRIIGYRRKILTDAGFTHFTVQDLDEKQVETFVNRWYDLALSDRPDEAKERKERILKSFKDSSSIRQLAGNPMLLTIMAIIGKHQELPRERWKLYDHAASVLIQHWDVNKHLKDQRVEADFIGEDDKKELLRRLAFKMQGAEGGLAGNYIHREELQAEFENYLIERYSQTADRAKVIAEIMIQQFRERNFILSLYGANLYGFVHRAFLEYFCTSAFVYKFEKTKELVIDQLKTDVYGKHWEDQSWHEVLRLICGMIDEKWVMEIIVHLLSKAYAEPELRFSDYFALMRRSDPHRWASSLMGLSKELEKVISLPAQCLSELKSLSGVGEVVAKFLGHHNWKARWDFMVVLCVHFQRQSQTLSLLLELALKDDNEYVRSAAVSALIEYYCDDAQTLPLLRDCSVKENDGYAQRVAFGALVEYYSDDARTLPLLRDRAVNDSAGEVRSFAVCSLGQYYQEDAHTLPLLRDRVINDSDEQVRLSAIDALGKYYSDDAQTMPLLLDRAVNDSAGEVRSFVVRSLGQYYHKDAHTLPLLRQWAVNSQHPDVRMSAVDAVGEYFCEDAQTLPLLREWAVNSQHPDVRMSTVVALGKYFREDAETLPLLSDRAVNDSSENVRSSALGTLGGYFQKDAQTLPLLRDRAVNDSSRHVRSRAVCLLGLFFHDVVQTLPLLRDRAVNDSSGNVRTSAFSALGGYFYEDAQTLPLLDARAVNDESPRPDDTKNLLERYEEVSREIAINSIARYWPDHPDTLPLLEDRAKNDPTPWLRERAKELIKELTEAKKKE